MGYKYTLAITPVNPALPVKTVPLVIHKCHLYNSESLDELVRCFQDISREPYEDSENELPSEDEE